MKRFEKYRNWIVAFVFAIAIIAVYKTFDNFYKITEFLGLVAKSLTPFVVGFVIAYILNIPASKIDGLCKKSKYKFLNKKSKLISILSVYLIMILIVYVAIRALVPALYRNFVDLYLNFPNYASDILVKLDSLQREYGMKLFDFNEASIMHTFERMLEKLDITELGKYAKGVVNVTSGVVKVFIGIIVSVYMLIDKEKIKSAAKRIVHLIFKEEKGKKVTGSVRIVNNIFSKYLFCVLLDAVIIAVLATVALSILKVKYAIILGIMIGLFNLIPYFGAIIAVTLSIIITLVTGGWLQALWAAIILLVLQQVDGNFIGPKIMGDVLDASPLWIILAVTLGGELFGVWGMLISVPVLVTIKMAVTQFINEKETEKNDES